MLNIFAIIFGALVGSFLNVCIYRLPREESIVFPGSHCPHCNRPIIFYDNIPLFSYLFLGGKCRHCGTPISLQYPIVEGVTAFFSLLLFLRFGLSIDYLFFFAFVSALIVITVIDLFHQIIPDVVSLPGIGVGLIGSLVLSQISFRESLTGALLGGGILFFVAFGYQWLFRREGMGGGDVKLLAMIGAFLGWKAVILTIFLSSLIGSIVGVLIMILKGKTFKYAIPFGPFLSLGAILALFWGKRIVEWYLMLNR